MSSLIEKLAADEHDRWARWMRWLYKNGTWNPDGSFTIDAERAQRWSTLASTDYFDLDEETKKWDRLEAEQRLAVIGSAKK